jgi:hypothetical protein
MAKPYHTVRVVDAVAAQSGAKLDHRKRRLRKLRARCCGQGSKPLALFTQVIGQR